MKLGRYKVKSARLKNGKMSHARITRRGSFSWTTTALQGWFAGAVIAGTVVDAAICGRWRNTGGLWPVHPSLAYKHTRYISLR